MSLQGQHTIRGKYTDQYNKIKRMELTQISQAVNLLGNWEWDLNANTLFWTDALYQLKATPLGLNNSISFEDNYHLIHVDDREMFMEKLECMMQRQDVEFEYRIVTSGGETRQIIANANLIKDDNGEPLCMRGTSRDITRQREMEKQLIELHQTFKEKNEALERSNKELSSFTYIASHDLQAPLRQIRTFTSRLAEVEAENLSDFGREYLTRIENASKRMQALIDDLLSWSRTDRSEKTFQLYDLNKMLNEIKSSFKDFIDEQKVFIETDKLPVVNVIPFQFKQLFENLIINSIKYSKPDIAPHIVITCETVDGPEIHNPEPRGNTEFYKFSIKDNGIGFDPQYAERIFELFQRLHDKHEYPGTGLGLSICKKIIENHKGFISATANPGQGATFMVFLPKSEPGKKFN